MDDTTHDATGAPQTTPGNGSGGGEPAPDASFGWTDETATSSGGEGRATAERMLTQLQSMIDTVATQAGPVVRQIGAKAAELAAVAADRAGPLAHKAADATADASVRIAEKSRTLAADLRRQIEADEAGSGAPPAQTTDVDRGGSAVADLHGASDAAEDAAADSPAEGDR